MDADPSRKSGFPFRRNPCRYLNRADSDAVFEMGRSPLAITDAIEFRISRPKSVKSELKANSECPLDSVLKCFAAEPVLGNSMVTFC